MISAGSGGMADQWPIDVRLIYHLPNADDGYRAPVDRIWPRG